MDKPISPVVAQLLAMASAMAPQHRRGGDPRGMTCHVCGSSMGHAQDCVEDLADKFGRHLVGDAVCRNALKWKLDAAKGDQDAFMERYDGDGLCARGRRLFQRFRDIHKAKDAEYESKMGVRPSEPRK